MSYRNYCITVNNYKEDELPAIEEFLKERAVYYILGREEGEEKQTPHIQGYVQMQKKVRLKAFGDSWVARLGRRPHVESAKGNAESNIKYCSKEDENPLEWGKVRGLKQGARNDISDLYDSVLDGKSNVEIAEENPSWFRYHKAVDRLREEVKLDDAKKEMEKEMEDKILRPWQGAMLVKLLQQDERKVLWIVDEKGGLGKTFMAKYLVVKQGACYVTGGKNSDIAHAYSGEPIVVFDLMRQQETHNNYYATIEAMKNGMIFSGKYESTTKVFKPAKIIVFANWEPDYSTLSADRWDVVSISDPFNLL